MEDPDLGFDSIIDQLELDEYREVDGPYDHVLLIGLDGVGSFYLE